jgi:hypothetical protein
MAPECFVVREIKASLQYHQQLRSILFIADLFNPPRSSEQLIGVP